MIRPMLCALLLVVFSKDASAQNEELWLTYNLQARFNQCWEGLFDANQRWGDFGQFNASVAAVRVGAARHFSEKFSAAAGYAWFGSYLDNEDNAFLDENRLWEQAVWRLPGKKATVWHRIRTEQRFRELESSSKGETEFNFRFRYMFGSLFPVVRPKEGRNFGMTAQLAWEIMLHAGGSIEKNYFDQNRFITGINWQISRTLSLATLYQHTLRYSLAKDKALTVHVFRITLSHQLDYRK